MKKPASFRRRIVLIEPGLQLRLISCFAGITALAFVLQSLLLAVFLSRAAVDEPELGPYLAELIPGLLAKCLLASFGLLLPLCFAVGVLVTFRIAGPLYRFKVYLQKVIAGEQIGPCKLRKGDELNDLCAVINEATAPLRRGRIPAREGAAGEERRRRSAQG